MSHVKDPQDWCGRKDSFKVFEGILLKLSPDPGFPLMSEQV